jgi:hypothetical protein
MRAWRNWLVAGFSLLALAAAAQTGDQLAVDVVNESEPTLCTEKDNVYLKLQSPEARRFTVEAVHPAYAGTIVVDRFAPDFTRCDMSKDTVFKFQPRQVTIFENTEWRLVGFTFDSFWRPNQVPVRVGKKVENGLHLYSSVRAPRWLRRGVVPYPPMATARAADAAFEPATGRIRLVLHGRAGGSRRPPLIGIKDMAYDPETKTFTELFARGGSATLRVEKLDDERIVLDVNLSQSAGAQRPFAALRSMFVSEGNSDVARIGWRAKDNQLWREEPVMSFKRANAAELWTGRLVPSRHNTSAPDVVFRDFSAAN